MDSPTLIVVSATSDIGFEICKKWFSRGWQVYGTFRTFSEKLNSLPNIKTLHCDLLNTESIQTAAAQMPAWDVLIFAQGDLNPIGPFEKSDFESWQKGIELNFLSAMRFLHLVLAKRKKNPAVLFFAGAGTNGAAPNYSSYAVSKIALIKMCELLDSEIPDTRFVILGPGWVKTKIHEATLKAGPNAGENGLRTEQKLSQNACTPIDRILKCIDWVITSRCVAISGRNYSVLDDPWEEKALETELADNNNLYKLRRCK